MPAVSVVIPLFDKARFLAQTLDGVRAQTFRDWELLVVDDGSRDGGPGIARAFAAGEPRARMLRHPGGAHLGAFASRLLGARRARAPVIALLDADDVWERDYLARHLRRWRSVAARGVGLSYGPAVYWFPERPRRRGFTHAMPSARAKIFAPGELLQNFLSSGHNTEPRTSASLLRREAMLAAARFSRAASKNPVYEDNFLMWSVAAGWPVAVHPGAWVRYRQRRTPGSKPGAYRPDQRRAERAFLPVILSDLARRAPGRALPSPEVSSADAGYFFERVPAALRRLAEART